MTTVRRIAISLDTALLRRLDALVRKKRASGLGMTRSELIRRAVLELLEREKK